jgi:hypothetical protein
VKTTFGIGGFPGENGERVSAVLGFERPRDAESSTSRYFFFFADFFLAGFAAALLAAGFLAALFSSVFFPALFLPKMPSQFCVNFGLGPERTIGPDMRAAPKGDEERKVAEGPVRGAKSHTRELRAAGYNPY